MATFESMDETDNELPSQEMQAELMQDDLERAMAEDGDENLDDEDRDDERDPFMTDAEADGDALASAGFGMDEDYGDTPLGDDFGGE